MGQKKGKALQAMTEILTSISSLAHIALNKPSEVIVDTSCTKADTEQACMQMERESLAIVCRCEYLPPCLYGGYNGVRLELLAANL